MACPSPLMHSGLRSICAVSSILIVTRGRDGTPVSWSMTLAIISLASRMNNSRALSMSCSSVGNATLDDVSISMAAETMRVQPGATNVVRSASIMSGIACSTLRWRCVHVLRRVGSACVLRRVFLVCYFGQSSGGLLSCGHALMSFGGASVALGWAGWYARQDV
eukprot:6101600-Amphidinium_carterae.1